MEAIRLITFCVGNQMLAIPLDQVQEVIRYIPPSPVREWAGLLHGIVSIRDMVIPVLDLRLLLEVSEPQNTSKTRILVVEMLSRSVGLVVDQVHDIIPLKEEQLVPRSSLCAHKGAILVGVANVDNKLYLMLDIQQIIHEEERKLFRDICLQLKKTNTPSSI